MEILFLLLLRIGVFFLVPTSSTTNHIFNVDAYPIRVLHTPKKRSLSLFSSLIRPSFISYPTSSLVLLSSSIVPSDVEEEFIPPTPSNHGNADEMNPLGSSTTLPSLKRQLIQLCATYDRGFGASPSARQTIDTILQHIQTYNTVQIQQFSPYHNESPTSSSTTTTTTNHFTMIGNWTMIYTTAFDVLSLQVSPFFMAGAIYQVYSSDEDDDDDSTNIGTSLTTVTNIIDFIPRFQSLFVSFLPSSILPTPPNTLIRATVQTRACVPRQPAINRIGLIFDSVSIQPIELLGMDSSKFLPPLVVDLPKLPTFGAGTSSSSSSSTTTPVAPGYFDVTYLDEDLLIIRQNAPGGIFCLLRTNTIDP